jgi:hypothetical protein
MNQQQQALFQHLAKKTKHHLRKALFGGLAFLGMAHEAQAQQPIQFGPVQVNPFGLRPALMPVRDTSRIELVRPAVVDIDGDGDLDVFVVSYQDSSINLLRNTGSPTMPQFAAPQRAPFSIQHDSSLVYLGLAFGDLDGDGDQDMVTTAYRSYTFHGYYGYYTYNSTQMMYHPNRGTVNAPVFDTSSVLWGLSTDLTNIQLFDYDGDGDLDILEIGTDYYGVGTEVFLVENIGTATAPDLINAVPRSLANTIRFTGGAAIGDLDRDGDLDILGGDMFNGNFFFSPDTSALPGIQLGARVVNVGGLTPVTYVNAPAFGDFDGDGDLDVLSGHLFVNLYSYISDSLGLRYFPNTTCDGRSLTIATSDRNDPNQPNGVATVTVTGATLPFVTVLNNNMPVNRLTATFDLSGLAEGTYTLRLTDSAQCKVQGTFTINRNIVSVEQLKQASLVLMPNPTSGTLFIQAPSALAEVRVLTLDGRLVQQWFHLQTNQLELGDLPNGLYLLQARTQDGQMFTEKFSKQ